MQRVKDTALQYRHGIAALLYIADYNMPDTRSINKRRREVGLWLLRRAGVETLAEQAAYSEKSLQCTQIINAHTKEPASVSAEAYREAKTWKTARKRQLDQCADILEHIRPPPDHNGFMAALAAAKAETPDALAEILATGGSVLIFGTPETIDGKTYWVSNPEKTLLRTMQKEWGLM